MLAILVPLMLAAAAPSDTDRSELEQKVVEIFRPYTAAPGGIASWDLPIYSAEITALIAQWRAVAPEGEVDALNDGDWLCQCQDWDAEAFTATIGSIDMPGEGLAEVELTVDLGFGGPEAIRPMRLTFKREEGAWKVDEIVAESFPNGLKQAMSETIAEDQALAGERG